MVDKVRGQLNNISNIVQFWSTSANHTHITEEERERVTNIVDRISKWLDEKVVEQEALKSHEEPAFSTQDIQAQMKPLTVQFEKIAKKPKPTPEKVPSVF